MARRPANTGRGPLPSHYGVLAIRRVMGSFSLLARQTAQTQKGFGLWTWSQACDEMPEVMGAAAVTAFVHHHVQPAGSQQWELFQGLVDEGKVRIDPRRARPQAYRGQRVSRAH